MVSGNKDLDFENIEMYILKSKKERQNHLRLSENCIEIGGDSKKFQALLAHTLKTTIPSGWIAILCHACNNSKCSNVKHLYWGTSSENTKDAYECGAIDRKKLSEAIKRGIDNLSEERKKERTRILSENGKKSKGRILFPERTNKRIELILNSNIDFTKHGKIKEIAKITGIHHSVVSDFVKKHLPDIYKKFFLHKTKNSPVL